MAINISRASNVAQPRFLTSAAAVLGGAVAAAYLTEYARDNVYDVEFQGGDLAYGVAGAAATLAVLSGSTGRMLAAGMIAGSGASVLGNDFNVF